MARPDPVDRAREEASGIAALLVTGLWLSLMLAGFEYWLPLMLFGYIVVVPLVSILFDEETDEEWVDHVPGHGQQEADHHAPEHRQRDTAGDEDADASDDEALQRLRERYANGELTDEQFERKLERLLETESLEDVEDRYAGPAGTGDRQRGVDDDRDRLRESE